MALLTNFWHLFAMSAPWLLLGLVIAGLIKVFIPENWLVKHLGKNDLKTTIKAAFIGAPLPLCSCGVIPAAMGLRRSGASKSATTAFLVATPETGVDSVSVSYVLLGPIMTIIRPIAAISSAIVAGVLTGRDDDQKAVTTVSAGADSCCSKNKKATSERPEKIEAASGCGSKVQQAAASSCAAKVENTQAVQSAPSCCGSKPKQVAVEAKTTCCASKKSPPGAMSGIGDKLKQAVSFAVNDLVKDSAKWLLVGIFFAALIRTYVPDDAMTEYGSGILAMSVMVLISIPMYICATASTPIAAGLLLSGVSPGAVLVFMLAGPATNIATLGVVGKELGRRAIVSYLIGVVGTALLFGYMTDWAVAEFGWVIEPQFAMGEMGSGLFAMVSGIVLAALMLKNLLPVARLKTA